MSDCVAAARTNCEPVGVAAPCGSVVPGTLLQLRLLDQTPRFAAGAPALDRAPDADPAPDQCRDDERSRVAAEDLYPAWLRKAIHGGNDFCCDAARRPQDDHGTQIGGDRCGVGPSHHDRQHVTGGRTPPLLGEPELGQRVPAFGHGLGTDQEDQQIAGADGLADARIVGIAFGELGAVEEGEL